MRKAFSYLRVSGRSAVKGDGFPRQRAAVSAYARANGIRIVGEFLEKGVSGSKDLENRPAFLALMTALHADDVTLVLIEKLDRLARDLMVQETILADLRKHGFDLVSVVEPDLLQDDPTRKLMRQIFGAVAEYEKTMLVLKLRAARQRMKAATGRCEGQRPYGTRPGEPEVVNQMQKLRRAGRSLVEIAEHLNAHDVRPRSGRQWYPMTVRNILRRQ